MREKKDHFREVTKMTGTSDYISRDGVIAMLDEEIIHADTPQEFYDAMVNAVKTVPSPPEVDCDKFSFTSLMNNIYFRDDETIEVYEDEGCYNEDSDCEPMFTLTGKGTLMANVFLLPGYANAKVGFCKPMGNGVYRVWLMLEEETT